jgi:hypothetical protein
VSEWRSSGVFRRRPRPRQHRRGLFPLPGFSLPGTPPSTLRIAQLTFQKATAAGLQTVSGVGFMGAALLIWTDRQAAVGVTDGAQLCVGMTDGVTQVVRSIHHPDNEAATTSAQAERTNRLVWLTNATSGAAPTVQAEGQFVAWTADGFTIDWLVNDGTASLFHVLVIGGVQASLQPVKITVNSGGTIVRTGLGFAPEAFVVLGGAADEFGTGDYNLGAPWGSIHGFGFSNAVDNMCGWTLGRGTAGASDTNRGQHTDRVVSLRTANLTGAGDLCSIQITATSADGFTVTRTVGTTTHQPIQHILALRGARFAMGTFNSPASPGTLAVPLTQSPEALLLQTHGLTTAEGDGMGLAMGAWQGGSEGGTWIGGTDNANPSVYARASYTDAILKSYTPAATGSASTLVCQASVASVSSTGATLSFTTVPGTPISILYLAIGTGGGTVDGEVPAGTNPPAASLPSSTPQFFGVLDEPADGTIIETHAEADGGPFNDNPTWFGGYKERRVLSFGNLTRKVTTPAGGIQLSTQRVVLDDTDLFFRSSWGTTQRRGKKWSTYVIEHGDRLAEEEPFRLGAGLVTHHEPLDGFQYALTVEGMLGRHIARKNNEAMAPPARLTQADLPEMDDRWSGGFSPPLGYGFLDDEDSAKPQGVVPGIYAGSTNLQDIYGPGAINIEADFYIFFGHAVQDTLNLYYTPPGWTASTSYRVGDTIRPNLASNGFLYTCTVAGTSGGSAPTFSLTIGATFSDGGVTWQNVGVDDPDLRYVVPPSAYGQIVADPHKPNWTTVTGSTDKFTSWNGHRLHVVLVRNDHPFAKALREGRMTLSGNFRGIEDVGDSTGALITAPSRIFQHFWTNFVENSWTDGAWFQVPDFGDYSLFDTDTVEAAHAVTDVLVSGGPVRASMLIGHRGQQITVFEVVKRMATSWDLKFAENRHGQIITLIDNPAAPATVSFNQQDDAITFTSFPRRQGFATTVRYRYGPRHVPPVSTQLEGEQGQPMPASSFQEHAEWVSGLQTVTNATALANNDGKEEYLDLDLWGVRDQATADMYAARALAKAVGPTAALEGPVGGKLVTGLQGLMQGSTVIDLGTKMALTHIEGLGASGYVDAEFIVDEIDVQCDTCQVTLSGDLQG